jgi:F-type H+-transporting ATPase subunit delta
MASTNGEQRLHETVMDVTVEQLARVYAQAFIGAAGKPAESGAYVEELQSVVDGALDRFPQFEQVLQSSLVSSEQKEELLDRVFGKSGSPLVVNFLKVLSRRGRLVLLRSIARQAEKLQKERSGLTDVDVRVAKELDDDIKNEIQTRVHNALGTKPILNISVDPSLIAGIVVRVGDRIFDGSLKTRLEQARHGMIARATEQIETAPDRFLSAS